ncbi:MAG: type II toxin-antitoxin system PemK/MazF family toxin [Saprospiraceae bacterium]
MTPSYKKGDFVWVDLGEPDGHVQGYKRPCVVLASFPKLGLAIIAACTSKKKPYSTPTSVFVPKEETGQRLDTVILLQQTRVIPISRIENKIGTMSSDTMDKVDVVLSEIFDL